MKLETMCLLLNVSLMIFTTWLIWYFDNGWWILLFVLCNYSVETKRKEKNEKD